VTGFRGEFAEVRTGGVDEAGRVLLDPVAYAGGVVGNLTDGRPGAVGGAANIVLRMCRRLVAAH
jgi:hypothetical protein